MSPSFAGPVLGIVSTTRLLGVIGDPIAHSLSPDMHNAAISVLEMDYCYVAFHVLPDRVEPALQGMRALQIRGLNVTLPHKTAVMAHLDQISEEALAVGAVNTISFEEGDLVGHNTDVYGLATALERTAGLAVLPEHCVILGAGGVARAAVYALATNDDVRRVSILNRTVARAEALAHDMGRITGKTIDAGDLTADTQLRVFADAGLVVNGTSLGMVPDVERTPLADTSAIHSELVLYDTVFNPLDTLLMRQFRSAGAPAFGGLDMLVHQGARSFAIWTGVEPPVDVMKRAIIGRFRA